MKWRDGILFCLAVLLAFGCGPRDGIHETAAEPAPRPAPAAETPAPQHVMDIGDVEAHVRVEADPDVDAAEPNIKLTRLVDARDRVNLVSLDVSPPWPETLPIKVLLSCDEAFRNAPVALRARALVEMPSGEEVELGRFTAVFGNDAYHRTDEYEVELMEALGPEPPETCLVLVRAEALLMPEGTDEATVDPETATTEAGRQTELLSNPVRINFVNRDDTP